MRSRNLPLTLATLTLFLSFQEQCRIQAQAVEAGQLAATSSDNYPSTSRLGREHAAEQEEVLQRRSSARRAAKGSLKQRQLLNDDSAPAVVVRPVRQSGSSSSSSPEEETENADVDLSRAVRAAASTASASAARFTRSVANGPRPGEPTSTSVRIPVTETDVTQPSSSSASSSSSSSSSSSESSSSSPTSSSSSTETTESSSMPTSSPSSSSSSHRSSESPSTVFSTTTLSSSSSSDTATATGDSAPLTNVWQAYNKSSKYFPVAIVITVVVGKFVHLGTMFNNPNIMLINLLHFLSGIAILVALVAILQCIARAPRFRKNKDRPLLIPRDSTWSDSNLSATSTFQNGDNASRRGSISSQAAAARRGSWETFSNNVPSRVNSNSSNKKAFLAAPERDMSSASTWAKEDFLPHAGEEDAPQTPAGFSIVDVYPALPKFTGRAPLTTSSNLASPYPPFPTRSSVADHPQFQQTTLPVIRKVDPAIVHHGQQKQQQQPMMERL